MPRTVGNRLCSDAPADPSAASAHGFHHHWGPGWGFGGIYVNTGVDSCLQERVVPTRHGPRVRVVNVCGYRYLY